MHSAAISENGDALIIKLDEVARIELVGDELMLHTDQGQYKRARTIQEIADALKGTHFKRADRSNIVNLDKVVLTDKKRENFKVYFDLEKKNSCTVSKRNVPKIKKCLKIIGKM